MKDEKIKDKVFAISGASSGLGRALAIHLAKGGAMLSLLARDKERLQQTADECMAANKTKPHTFIADIREGEQCAQWINAAAANFGHLDCLVNNAGISMRAAISDIADLGDYRAVMDTGFWGAAQCAHSALPHLRKSGGIIVNISSVQGKTAIPYHAIYAASKHAMEGFFMSMAMEEPNIHILSVRPGWITNTRINQNRITPNPNDNANKTTNDADDKTRKGTNTTRDGLETNASREGAEVNKSGEGLAVNASDEGLEVEYCAQQIIKAIQTRRETLTLPSRYKYLPLLSELFPRKTRQAITKKTNTRYGS